MIGKTFNDNVISRSGDEGSNSVTSWIRRDYMAMKAFRKFLYSQGLQKREHVYIFSISLPSLP
jgi:hypothetical protein